MNDKGRGDPSFRSYNKKSRHAKRRDRQIRNAHRRILALKEKLGLGDYTISKNYNSFSEHIRLYIYKNNDEFAYGSEIHNVEEFKELITSNIPIINVDTKEEYANFEEFLKEKYIIKLASLKE